MTTILGLNAYLADSAACLVSDGEMIAVSEEKPIMAHDEPI